MKFPIGFGLFGAGCVIVALSCFKLCLFYEGKALRDKARASWVQVQAVVLTVDRVFGWQRGGQKQVRYKYAFHGSIYISGRTTFFGELRGIDSRKAEEPSTVIYEGVAVNVLVNPVNPAEAVRRPEEPSDAEVSNLLRFYIGLLSAGGVAAFVGFAMMYAALHPNLKSEQKSLFIQVPN